VDFQTFGTVIILSPGFPAVSLYSKPTLNLTYSAVPITMSVSGVL